MSNKKVHYLIVDGYIVDDDEKIENIISSYHNYVFIEASVEDVERVTSSVCERISISTSDGDAKIYITDEDVVYVSESGDWYIRTTRIPAEIETFVEPDIEDETESEVESDTVTEIGPDMEPEVQDTILCIGYDFLFPYAVEAIYITGPDFEDYVQNPEKTNDYILTYACLPYYKVEGFNHPVVEEVRDSADATRMYYGYPDGTWSVQIRAGDKYVALYDDKWYVGATDVIPGQNLFAERGLAQTVKDGDILYKGIVQTSMFFEQYALHCFRETDSTSAQDVISHGREIVIDYYYYGLSYIYVYGDQMVVINHDGKIYSLVYVGQYADVGTGSEPETEPETEPAVESDSVTETESTTEPDTEIVTDPEIESETVAETEPEIEPDTEVVTDPEIESETVTETEPEIEPDTEVVTDPEIESETVTETEPEIEPDTEVVTDPEIESETVAETEPETESTTEYESDSESETDSSTEPETESGTESDTIPGTEPDTEPDTGSDTKPVVKPVIKPTPVGKRFSFATRPMPIFLAVREPEPLEFLIVRPPFYRNRFLNVKFENFITWIRRINK